LVFVCVRIFLLFKLFEMCFDMTLTCILALESYSEI